MLPFAEASAYDILHADALVIESGALGADTSAEKPVKPAKTVKATKRAKAAKPKTAKRAKSAKAAPAKSRTRTPKETR